MTLSTFWEFSHTHWSLASQFKALLYKGSNRASSLWPIQWTNSNLFKSFSFPLFISLPHPHMSISLHMCCVAQKPNVKKEFLTKLFLSKVLKHNFEKEGSILKFTLKNRYYIVFLFIYFFLWLWKRLIMVDVLACEVITDKERPHIGPQSFFKAIVWVKDNHQTYRSTQLTDKEDHKAESSETT